MRLIKDDTGRAVIIKLERTDTLEEMAAMSGLTMEDLAEEIEATITNSRKKREGKANG